MTVENTYYLVALLASISGLALIDRKLKLAFWHDAARTAKTLTAAITLFIIWDLWGIKLGVFFIGDSRYILPFEIVPEFPIEELFFLFLLTYVTLLLYRGKDRL